MNLSKNEVDQLLLEAKWKWATSKEYKSLPHAYTLSENWDRKVFESVVAYIREYGYKKQFFKTYYIYYQIEDFEYWTMGAPMSETILINKARISNQYGAVANQYAELFQEDEYKKENEEVVAMCDIQTDDRVCNIGCGTGLLLDYAKINNYIGVDDSWQMIYKAKAKHPDKKYFMKKFELFTEWTSYNYYIALFGTGSYISSNDWRDRNNLMDKVFLMFYKEDYNPVTYEMLGVDFWHYKRTKQELQDIFPNREVIEYNNYYIVK